MTTACHPQRRRRPRRQHGYDAIPDPGGEAAWLLFTLCEVLANPPRSPCPVCFAMFLRARLRASLRGWCEFCVAIPEDGLLVHCYRCLLSDFTLEAMMNEGPHTYDEDVA